MMKKSNEKYDVVIGLEVHAELNTNSKLFCACQNDAFTSPANENTCAVCLAKVDTSNKRTNRSAVEKTALAGLALGCKINDFCYFERKHYDYPDLPGGFQTTQDKKPICIGGAVTLKNGKTIRLNRIHLEEDAGKLIHDEVNGETLIDFNRAGVPLNEIVTEPDITSAAEAVEFLTELRSRLIFAGVANCRMEVNSFKMVARAIDFEVKRQTELLDAGKTVARETRRWNDAAGKSTAMRSKELAHDYNYIPDPNLPEIDLKDLDIKLPTLAHQYREQFITEYKLPQYDAEVLTKEKYICDFYTQSIALLNDERSGSGTQPKKLSNWLMTDILKLVTTAEIKLTPKQFTDVIKLTDARKITRQNAIVLFEELWGKPDIDAEIHAKKLKIFGGISREQIETILGELFTANPNAIADFATTPDKVINFFMGQTMKKTGGMADSVITKEIILGKLKKGG
jgi:aspartyl-tRNA(Asn)/glutamyl-tRNA(Gln) amidotransferase subunit B